MPSIEELLNEAESHMAAQPVNDVLEINPETREISIPDSEIILGVETDQKAERKYFHCPKIVGNNIDLSELELYVVFQNASNMEEGKDRYHVTDVKTTSDGYITFSWELSAKVTAYKGDVQFVVCAIKTDSSGVKQNVWNTTIAIGKCLIGLSSDMSASEEQSASDLYTQLISELNSTASAKLAEVTTQIQTVGNNQVSNVNSAGETQVNNVQNKGTEVLASIPDTYTELDASVKQLNEQIRGKAPVITESTTIQSGSPTTVTDSAEMPLQDMVIYGKSEQVTTTGANLAKPKLQSGLRSGITVTKYDDGSYNFKGTCTGDIYVEVYSFNVEIGKTYYFSGGAENGSSTTFQTYIISKDYSEIVGYNLVKKSFKANKELYYLNCAIYKGTTVDFTIKPMLNLGSEELPFEPYTGGKPSPSPEYPQEIVSAGENGSIGIEITGKNLLNEDKYYSAYKQTDGIYKVDNVKANDIIIIFDSSMVGKTYTASCNLNCPNTVSGVLLEANIDNEKERGNIIFTNKSGISKITFTPKTVRDNIKITHGTGKGDIIFSDFQIEAGSFATSYESYKTPSTATIPLQNGLPGIPVTTGGNYTDANGKQYICNEIDFAARKYVQRVKEIVLDGSYDEVWTYNIGAHRANIILNNGNLGTYDKRGIASMCSNLLWNRNVYLDSNRENGYLINNNTFFVRVAESLALNTEPDFRTWLASNPITLQYVLATPIETDLSEAQIQAYKSLTTFKPTSIISNDAGAQMNVEYACDTKTWVTNKINTLIKEATTS